MTAQLAKSEQLSSTKQSYPYFFASLIYSIGQITLGLLLHPYQTMQLLVQEKVFVLMSLLPTVLLGLVTVLWRYLFVPLVRVVFSCTTAGFFGCDYIDFASNWLTFFIVFWQLLLLYLFFRFWWLYRD